MDLSELTADDWLAAAHRWQDADHGTIEYLDTPPKHMTMRDRYGSVCGVVEYDSYRSALIFKHSSVAEGILLPITLQIGVPDYAGLPFEFAIQTNREPLAYHVDIRRQEVPADGAAFLEFLWSAIPHETNKIGEQLAEFWEMWISVVDPVTERGNAHDDLTYQE